MNNTTEAPPAPYPADTRAKGWRFELDLERVRQSDTWAVTPVELRPWLLMLWAVAWEQTPCGSLPNDDELIAARIGMTPSAFALARPHLLRKWWLAQDGRLYHWTIVERVTAMLEARDKAAARQRGHRTRLALVPQPRADRAAAGHDGPPPGHPAGELPPEDDPPGGAKPDVTRDLHVSTPVSHDTGTSTSTSTGTGAPVNKKVSQNKHSTRKAALPAVACPDGLDPKQWDAFIALRKAKNLPLTEGAWDLFVAEGAKAGLTPAATVRECITRGWGGFKASWLAADAAKGGKGFGGAPDTSHQWWASSSGLLAKGDELGVKRPKDDGAVTFMRYRAAVWVAAGDGPWWDDKDSAYSFAVKLRNGGGGLSAAAG